MYWKHLQLLKTTVISSYMKVAWMSHSLKQFHIVQDIR